MALYKNQEIQVSAKFIGIGDDGKYQVKIHGIDAVQFNVDPKYINVTNNPSPMPSTTTPTKDISQTYAEPPKVQKVQKIKKKKKKTELEKASDAAWGASDDENENDNNSTTQPPDVEDIKEEQKQNMTILDVSDISIGDEKFHHKHKYKTLSVEHGGSVVKTTENRSVMAAFGSVQCNEVGKTYHWKVQIVEGTDVNLGVIFSDFCKKNRKQMWWLAAEGYSYWGDDGQIYHSDKYKVYGDKYGGGDVIDVWLNLKKFYVSFAKNGEKYGKAFKVDKEQTYRFGVGLSGHPHTLQIIQFDVK